MNFQSLRIPIYSFLLIGLAGRSLDSQELGQEVSQVTVVQDSGRTVGLKEVTRDLAAFLQSRGKTPPGLVISPEDKLQDIVVQGWDSSLDEGGLARSPEPPPPGPKPTPFPEDPAGPDPFMPPPPTLAMLEQYRESLEELRRAAEKKREMNAISLPDYRTVMAGYRSQVLIYKEAVKLVTPEGLSHDF